MIVVADSGPLRYLLVIGHIDTLPRMFERVLIPAAVREELTHRRTPAAVRSWMESPPSWLEVRPPLAMIDDSVQALDEGVDDEAGRALATRLGLEVVGTIGILQRAANRGLLDLRIAISALLATNFRISPTLRRTIVEQLERQ